VGEVCALLNALLDTVVIAALQANYQFNNHTTAIIAILVYVENARENAKNIRGFTHVYIMSKI